MQMAANSYDHLNKLVNNTLQLLCAEMSDGIVGYALESKPEGP